MRKTASGRAVYLAQRRLRAGRYILQRRLRAGRYILQRRLRAGRYILQRRLRAGRHGKREAPAAHTLTEALLPTTCVVVNKPPGLKHFPTIGLTPDRQKVVHAYREIAAGASRFPCRFASSYIATSTRLAELPWKHLWKPANALSPGSGCARSHRVPEMAGLLEADDNALDRPGMKAKVRQDSRRGPLEQDLPAFDGQGRTFCGTGAD